MSKLLQFSVAYFVIVFLTIIGYFLNANTFLYIVKPFIPISIGFYYLTNKAKTNTTKTNVYFGLGLLFSLIGDFLFIGDLDRYFLIGMTSYLLMHFFYMRVFRQEGTLVVFPDWRTLFKVLPVILFVFIYFGVFILQKAPIEVFILSALYTFVIISLFLLLFLRKTNKKSYIYGLLMITFFMIDSTIIGYQKFVLNDTFNQLIIIPIYAIGQYCMLMTLDTHTQDLKKWDKRI
jgi:uncharacterized membrane protein YhhN